MKEKYFDEAADLFWLWDKDLNLIDVNKAALRLFNMKKEDIVGKHVTQLSPDAKSSGRYDKYLEVIRTGKSFEIDDIIPHTSLGNFHLRVKAFKVGDGVGTMATNITDLVQALEELETFIYKTSHDMRSPIASSLGLLSLAETSKNSDGENYYKLIADQIHKLDGILKVLVDAASIRKGEKIIRLINFESVINEVLIRLEKMPGFNKIKFETNISSEQEFHSDKLLIVTLFQNLIENAIKYKKENINDSFVKISVTDKNGGVKISIEDNGFGIPENLQKDVFRIFFRASAKEPGSGLGLFTVNQTIKKLNGIISLTSKEKIGTTFTIYLPNEKKAEP